MNNVIILKSIVKKLQIKLDNKDFIVDKTGAKLVELIGEKLELNPEPIIDLGVKKTNLKYAMAEVEWYDSMELKTTKIINHASLWGKVCSKNHQVNSNYGWLIYSNSNFSQYEHCLEELRNNNESRRAVMIYQRPSIWVDFNIDGMNDFICTDGIQCFIRNNKLIYIVKQRSCDFFYGFFNDFYWHCTVYKRLIKDLSFNNDNHGQILYFPFSLHVYEKHFEILKKM